MSAKKLDELIERRKKTSSLDRANHVLLRKPQFFAFD